ncbi:hypothetical protein J5J86_22665 [Aquabacter sp. L1I39]|uniref:hypothetical protein n=1 Tax=Aquabacter sp. L1I39 TaxID=2820278 RepID=UPI001ADB39C5|nr:hypothetical protein [Aquabacter sp. L1I39]QTL03497.1 hypothetical protein J5J86_22665 [Aquabacter sp. L1I39]
MAALLLGVAALIPLALAASGPRAWTVRDQGETIEAFTRNRAGSTALVLSCRPGGPTRLSLILSPKSGWRPEGTAVLDIDGVSLPVTVEAFGAGVFLSDLAGGALGLKPDTVKAIGAGKMLILAGPPARAMTEAGRAFDLSGAGDAIARLATRCGLNRPAPAASQPVTRLPLAPGEYSTGPCTAPPDAVRSIGLYIFTDGRFAGRQFLSPAAEGMFGVCTLAEPLSVAGNVYSGAPACESGGRASSDLGRYRFSFQILDEKTFISNGKTYAWCAAHR